MSTIYTLGYTGCKPEDLKIAAKKHHLVVLDTRYSPMSRNPGWGIINLRGLLQGDYRAIPALGNKNYKNGGPIEILDLPDGLRFADQYLKRGISVLLLCACPHLETCHRKLVAEKLAEYSGCQVIHWTPADLKRIAAGEGTLL